MEMYIFGILKENEKFIKLMKNIWLEEYYT